MRALATVLARRIPIVRGLLDPRHSVYRESELPVVSDDPALPPASHNPFRLGAEHSETATAEDIFYCFRLLLGRNPNPEEWPGHSSRAGEDLENVVSSYVTSREFADRGLFNKTYQDKVELVQFPSFSLFASSEDLAIGRHVLRGHPYDAGIAALINRYVKPGMAV